MKIDKPNADGRLFGDQTRPPYKNVPPEMQIKCEFTIRIKDSYEIYEADKPTDADIVVVNRPIPA